MKIQTLLNEEALLLESHMIRSRKILKESCDGLTRDQRRIVEGIYNELRPLIEASLTADQIKGIFGAVEKQAVASGGSRTAVGAGVDVVKKANEIVNNVGKWLQNTTPVKMADQKFEDLKAKVGAKFPELDKQLTGLGSWMKENPGKTAAIIGVMTALASLAGGPVGGAIAGQVLRGSAELIKGEKLSTAVGKGIKTAAYGFIAGWLIDSLGDWLEGLRASVLDYPEMPGLVRIDVELTKSMSGPGFSFEETINSIVVPADQQEGFMAILEAARGGDINAFNDLSRFADNFDIGDYLETKAATDAVLKAITQENDAFLQNMTAINDGIRAAAQGAVAGKLDSNDVKVDGKPAGDAGKQESYYLQQRPLSEGQIYFLFNKIDRQQDTMMEGPMDLVKKGLGAAGKAASWVGKQATEKITSAKLLASWKLEGSPTDSEELAKFLQGQGVSDDIVKQVYGDMKLPEPGSQPAEPLGTHGYDDQLGMAFTSEKDRAEFAELAGYDLGKPTKPRLDPKAQPWDAERFKREALPKLIQDAIEKMTADEKRSLLSTLQPAKA